jgi:hypothetical protein
VDPICKTLLLSAENSLLYELNEVGILVQKSSFDGSQQIVVPQSLFSRILYLEHYPPSSGHPGAHRMFQKIRKTFFWPRIAEESTKRFENAIFVPGIVYRRKGKRTRSSSFPRTGLWSPLLWIFWDRSRGRNTETVFYW